MSKLRSQEEIMKTWRGETQKTVVSICCITYNHEPYIKDALDSFLSQSTEFSFEILIHDDASTDSTADIINEYQKLYPDIIKPIFQRENQYSKGIKVNPAFNFSRANGKYIALCEGDDYWVDNEKLQKQVAVLESNEQISLIFHSAQELDCVTRNEKIVSRVKQKDGKVSNFKIISGRGILVPTASMCFRAECLKDKLSIFDKNMPVGDFFMQSLLAFCGAVYYQDSPMSVYRRNAPGAWTSTLKGKDNRNEYYCQMKNAILYFYTKVRIINKSIYLVVPYCFYTIACYRNGPKMRIFRHIRDSLPLSARSFLFIILFLILLPLYPVVLKVKSLLK